MIPSTRSSHRDLAAIAPFDHDEAMAIAAEEYRRLADLLDTLTPTAWSKLTDCPAWTVADMIRHLIGSMHASASVREQTSQLIAAYSTARRAKTNPVDELSAEQVRRNKAVPDAELAALFRGLIDGAVRGRTKLPAPVRSYARFRVQMGTINERWNLGFLVDTVLTRDTWMHRVDVSRAVGTAVVVDERHDGRIVQDIAREWASRHNRRTTLMLSGSAGGRYTAAGTAEHAPGHLPEPEIIEMDAIEFCRTLAGRGMAAHPLLKIEVAF